jgi:hypothetical protein
MVIHTLPSPAEALPLFGYQVLTANSMTSVPRRDCRQTVIIDPMAK